MFQVLVQFTLLTQPNHNVGVVSQPFPAAQQKRLHFPTLELWTKD
jgi:hypothetical protein